MQKPKTKTIELPRSAFTRELDRRIAMFEDFEVSITSKTCLIKPSPHERLFFADDKFSKKVFPLCNEIKAQIDASGIEPPGFNPNDIKYYRFQDPMPEYLPVAYGYDINSAYLQCLYNIGYIDKPMFDKIKELPKKDRLAVIGMLATSKTVYSFHQGEIIDARIEEDSKYRGVFFHISYIVGLCLDDIFHNSDSVFYWVDGIITRSPLTSKKFRAHGFEIKEEKIIDFRSKFYPDQKLIRIKYVKDEKPKRWEISKTIFLQPHSKTLQ